MKDNPLLTKLLATWLESEGRDSPFYWGFRLTHPPLGLEAAGSAGAGEGGGTACWAQQHC